MAASIIEGGYDYEFITDLPEDLTCVLCHFAFKNPVQVEECGHVFCKQCFDNMKDHAESTCVDLLCPLDRQNIDVTRVFKDKSDERRVLNLMVKCQNFGDKCDWTGELKQALEHETKCGKDDTMFNNPFEAEFKQLINRMAELEVKVKVHGQKLAEKNTQIINQNKQIVNLNKHIENQEKHNVSLDKQIVNLNSYIENQDKQITDQKNHSLNYQNKQIEDLKKQIESFQNSPTNSINLQPIPSSPLSMIVEQIKHIEEQSKQIGDQKKQIENQAKEIGELKTLMVNQSKEIKILQQFHNNDSFKHKSTPLSMIIPNVVEESNYSPICTAFQWKFNPTEVKSVGEVYSPPFYNIMNAHCFQLGAEFIGNIFEISLQRYRGKYDHKVKAIKVMKNIDFHVHIFGKNGKLKIAKWDNNEDDYSIGKHSITSQGYVENFNNNEIENLVIDGFVPMHCFFGDIFQC